MSRPKGGKNREWSKEAKYSIIIQIINGEKSSYDLEKEHNGYYSMLVSGNNRKRAHAFYEKEGYEKMGGFRKMY